jgi:hypothetical protein
MVIVMSFLHSLFGYFGTWFGYVGSCVASPLPTCRPFLAFVLLTLSGGVSLAMLLSTLRRIAGVVSAGRAAVSRAPRPSRIAPREPYLGRALVPGPGAGPAPHAP